MNDDPRIPEILALRAADPSLGLKEAKDIVDARRATALTEEALRELERKVAGDGYSDVSLREFAHLADDHEGDDVSVATAALRRWIVASHRARQADVLERRVAELEHWHETSEWWRRAYLEWQEWAGSIRQRYATAPEDIAGNGNGPTREFLARHMAALEAGLRDACDAIDNLSPSALVRDANVPDLRHWRSLLNDATKDS